MSSMVAERTQQHEDRGRETPRSNLADDSSAVCPDPLSRWVLAAIGAGFLVVCFAQSWGLIEEDTKFSLIMKPLAFMESTLSVWHQNAFGGNANPFGVGFDLPMGPFFGVAQLFHLPTWCAERLWLALLLTVGCWGVVRLAEALGIGKPWARVLAGLVYCTAPMVVVWVETSAYLAAVVLLPWVVLPLVVGSREGSPRRAAARSGVAVALMGGVNAAVIVATLPMAALWLLTRKRGPRRRALIGWWIVAIGLACFWWLILLVISGKYGYNYLPYTETASVTTSTTSLFEALRGASNWLTYDTLGGPASIGAWTIVSTPVIIVATTLLSALGLAGLCRRIPERLFLVATSCFGVAVIAIGYSGKLGGPFASTVQHLLGTSLTPLRNVSKFAPDVALPLALGLAWTVSTTSWGKAKRDDGLQTASASPSRGSLDTVSRYSPDVALPVTLGLVQVLSAAWSQTRWHLRGLRAVSLVAVAAIAIAATPFWHLQLYGPGGIVAIPRYWSQTGKWLDAHQGRESALVLPGASFADYTWGNPRDEPLAVLTNTSIQSRTIIPLGSNGNTQVLDTIEQAIDSGNATPGLAQYLAREGIGYVVERNDLNLHATGAPPPAQVHQVLTETPGLRQVASFGSILPAHQVSLSALSVYDSPSDLKLRPVEIFKVEPSASIVRTYPVADPVVVSGDAGSLLPLAGAGALVGRATALSGDPLARGVATKKQATWAITDGNQRRDFGYGSFRNNDSYLLGANQRTARAVAGVPQAFIVVAGTKHQTVAAPLGAASVSASSYGSSVLFNDPSQGPASAFDNDPTTAWVADATNRSLGQWVSITFDHPVAMSTITVTPLVGLPEQPTVKWVTIATDQGAVRRYLPPRGTPVRLSIPAGNSLHLKITIDEVRPPAKLALGGIVLGAGITDVKIPGVRFEPNMKVPNDEASSFSGAGRNPPVIVLNRPISNPNLALGLNETDDPRMSRTVTLAAPLKAKITGTAIPQAEPSLSALLDVTAPPPSSSLTVTASSWLGDLPRFRPDNLAEHSGSPWIAAIGDSQPSITLRWNSPKTVDSIALVPSTQASVPTEISISSPTESRADLPVPRAGGIVSFTPLTTDSLKVTFVRSAPRVTVVPATGVELTMPVGIAAVGVPSLYTVPVAPPSLATPVTLSCGHGPAVSIDGTLVPTSVSGTLGDLIDLRPMQITACTPTNGLPLTAGTHLIQAPTTDAPFEITSLFAQSSAPVYQVVSAPRKATIGHWSPDSRTVVMGAGAATYLVMAQNYNVGWVAKMGTRTLTPVRIDGWQQGYIVPKGSAGTVTLTMVPNSLFRLWLALGAALLVGLLLLALIPSRRSRQAASEARELPLALLAGGAVVVLVVVAGPLALLAVPLLWAARRWGGGAMALVAFVAFVAGGVVVAWHPGALPGTGNGAFGGPAQVASAIALAAVLCALVAERAWPRRSAPAAPGASTRGVDVQAESPGAMSAELPEQDG